MLRFSQLPLALIHWSRVKDPDSHPSPSAPGVVGHGWAVHSAEERGVRGILTRGAIATIGAHE